MTLSKDEVLAQSRAAMQQWEGLWRANAEKNKRYMKQSLQRLMFSGAGRTALVIAYSPSIEKQIEDIKLAANNPAIDIICVDKCLHALTENGIEPKHVVIADASIGAHYIRKSKSNLIANICANPQWIENWAGKIYFYVNKDNIGTEKIFAQISGCTDLIPASSNVGNAAVVLASQVFGYSKVLLAGYDFCWADNENYYAFEDSEKRYYMKNYEIVDSLGRLVNTSANLQFSAKWLADYFHVVPQVRFVNCTIGGLIFNLPKCSLKKQAENTKLYSYNAEQVRQGRMRKAIYKAKDFFNRINEIKKLNIDIIEIKYEESIC